MQTIELVGEKSVVKFDLETMPDAEFVHFQGKAYTPKDAERRVWQLHDGDVPLNATRFVVAPWAESGDELGAPLGPGMASQPASRENPDANKAVVQQPTPTEGAADAQPDHTKTV